MKNYMILFVLTLVGVGCNKNNGNSGGGTTPANPNKDVDNFITIDGVTNYHYSTPSGLVVMCNSNSSYQWSNYSTTQPDYGTFIQIVKVKVDSIYGTQMLIGHVKNGSTTTYHFTNPASKVRLFPETIINGYTTIDLKNIKVYEGNNPYDSTGTFKYVTARLTCNGK